MKTLATKADQQEILTRIAQLSPTDQRLWGKMSVHQMMCHLTDSYNAALGQKNVSSATLPVFGTVLKWGALRLPLRWGKGFPTRPEMEQGVGGTPPIEFEYDKQTLQSCLHHFCDDLPQPCLPHPIFGRMTPNDWWRWGYLHADHHLRQFSR